MVDLQKLAKVMDQCEQRYSELVNDGCDEDVAACRVYDALRFAAGTSSTHCYDRRDRSFERALVSTMEKG